MGRIIDMVNNYCPSGVPYYALRDVTEVIGGYTFKSTGYSVSGARVIRISDVQDGFISDKDVKYFPFEFADKVGKAVLQENDVVVSLTGFVGRVAYVDNSIMPAYLNQRVACLRSSSWILPRFLFHVLHSKQFLMDAEAAGSGSAQKNLSMKWVAAYEIPVPPLEVQHEVVRVLDSFVKLETELEAELEARKTQYAHYRDELLSRENLEAMAGGDVETLLLGDAEKRGYLKLGRGRVISKKAIADNPGHYPVYSASAQYDGKMGEYGDWMFDDVRLTWSVDGGGKFFYRDDERYSVTNVCGWLKVLEEDVILPRFLFYSISTQWESIGFDYTRKAHPSVIRDLYVVPVPPLSVQRQVVDILDRFDALTTSLTDGLPAEIEARRQQYEHYRDRLLDFPRKEVA